MSEQTNLKNVMMRNLNEIKQLCENLKYVENTKLLIFGLNEIYNLVDRTIENIEHLNIK